MKNEAAIFCTGGTGRAAQPDRTYGIVSLVNLEPDVEQVNSLVEKPSPEAIPSTLAVARRHILASPLMQEYKWLTCRFSGIRYDCGSKLG